MGCGGSDDIASPTAGPIPVPHYKAQTQATRTNNHNRPDLVSPKSPRAGVRPHHDLWKLDHRDRPVFPWNGGRRRQRGIRDGCPDGRCRRAVSGPSGRIFVIGNPVTAAQKAEQNEDKGDHHCNLQSARHLIIALRMVLGDEEGAGSWQAAGGPDSAAG
ncbi:hypothetical protein PAV19gp26 [Psittacine adenovirus 3]|uniref:Uncharacterized protein n=1 Tax=Psittacine adenovirus 3 TaxID=1580497 RepID=A0A0A7JTK4_9ADEN|nr:hypothetical protein SC17_gp26 [Psittacine adenovirus 3]AIZ35787.1 hypothetical protein PAV19gp26 [Psittacine adenovirus 3]